MPAPKEFSYKFPSDFIYIWLGGLFLFGILSFAERPQVSISASRWFTFFVLLVLGFAWINRFQVAPLVITDNGIYVPVLFKVEKYSYLEFNDIQHWNFETPYPLYFRGDMALNLFGTYLTLRIRRSFFKTMPEFDEVVGIIIGRIEESRKKEANLRGGSTT